MKQVPETSTTLLRDVADSQHARWSVLYSRYRPMMEAYLQHRFPSLDAEDIIQETFVALTKILPDYQYNPEKKGAFHNYLTGILRNKALCALDARNRVLTIKERMQANADGGEAAESDQSYQSWRDSVFELALQQVLDDSSIQERTKQVFIRTAIKGESIEAVAESLGMTRHAADCIRSRLAARLREIVDKLKDIC